MFRFLDRSVLIGIALAFGLIIMTSILSYRNVRQIDDAAAQVEHTYKVIGSLAGILSLAKDAETGQRGYLITADPAYLQPYRDATSAVNTQVDTIAQLTHDNPRQQERIPDLRRHVMAKLDELQKIIDLRDQRGFEAAQQVVLSNRGKQIMDELRALIDAMTQTENELLRTRADEQQKSYQAAIVSGATTGILGLIVVGALVYLLRRWLDTRLQAAEQLAESQRFLRASLDALSSHIAVLDELGVILEVNAAWRRFAESNGLQNTHYAVGQNYLATYEPGSGACEEDALRAADHIRAVINGDQPFWTTEYPCHSPTEQRWFQMRVTRFAGSGPVRVVVAHEDITPRVLSEQATHRRSEQLRGLADIATQLNVAHDVGSILSMVSEGARAIIGVHQAFTSQMIDQDWSRAVHATALSDRYDEWRNRQIAWDDSELYALVYRTNQTVRMTQAELEAHPAWQAFARRASNRPPFTGWLAVPLTALDGRNIGLVQLTEKVEGEFSADDEAILVQLARMAAVALENTRLYQALRTADQRKDEFLATLAHELRNPLAPIRNGLEIMRLAGNNGTAIDRAQAMMERQLNQMVRLVDDLLDVSRITRGKLELRKERVELAAVVGSAVETSRSLIEHAGHALSVTLPPEPIMLDADPVRLAQVFSNLLNNAAKYTEPGGCIWLSAGPSPPAPLPQGERGVKAPPPSGGRGWGEGGPGAGSEVVISVRDNGLGIPAAMLPKVFDLFTQVDQTLERARGGLGIGLTLVKQLVEMHGGTVEALSDGPGKGTEFRVRLPVAAARPEPAQSAEAGGSVAQPTAQRRILVVDDNQDAAFSLATLLKILGNDALTAHDGLAAVEAAAEYRPDVVLLDIGMPRLNGYDAARRIRALPGGADMVLIALTGWGQEEDKRRSRESGFDYHLVKPVSPAVIKRLLAELPARRA